MPELFESLSSLLLAFLFFSRSVTSAVMRHLSAKYCHILLTSCSVVFSWFTRRQEKGRQGQLIIIIIINVITEIYIAEIQRLSKMPLRFVCSFSVNTPRWLISLELQR